MSQRQEFDYIVCGGGSAGCVLAARLSEDPNHRVLLIEAGTRDSHFLYHWPAGFAKMTKGMGSWGFETVPQKHMQGRKLWYTQAKVIGGGSTINAQLYNRGHRLDFDHWRDEFGCEGWGYEDILPYFKRSEGNDRFENEFHSGQGPLGVSVPQSTLPIADAFIRGAQQMGISYNPDFNGSEQAGIGYYQLTQKNARRCSTAVAFLHPAESRTNLEVRYQSQVERIVIEKGRAVGVMIAGKIIYAKAEVIVSSGAIGSPVLLMRSGIGPADHLRESGVKVVVDHAAVGRNFHDHIDLAVLAECAGPYSHDGVVRFDRMMVAGFQYLLFKSGPVTSALFETGGFWYTNKTEKQPDIQFHLGLGSGIEAGIVKLKNHGLTLNSAYLQPKSRGSVRLGKTSEDMPRIDPNYWAEPEDLEMSLKGLEIARTLLRQDALAPFLTAEALPGDAINDRESLFDYACKIAKTDHHPVGTCRMGADADAVVDAQLRFRGIEALRIVDASVMPRIVSANTNAATIMIGEKAADLILGKAPLKPQLPSLQG